MSQQNRRLQPRIAKLPLQSNKRECVEATAPKIGSREYATMLYTTVNGSKGANVVKGATALWSGYSAMPISGDRPKDALGRNDQGYWTAKMPTSKKGLEMFTALFKDKPSELLTRIKAYDATSMDKELKNMSIPDERDFMQANSIADDNMAACIDGSFQSIVANDTNVDAYRKWEQEQVEHAYYDSTGGTDPPSDEVMLKAFEGPPGSIGITGNYMCFGISGKRVSSEPKGIDVDEVTIRESIKSQSSTINKMLRELRPSDCAKNEDFIKRVHSVRDQFIHLMQNYGVSFQSGVHRTKNTWTSLVDFMLSSPQIMRDLMCVARSDPKDSSMEQLRQLTRTMFVSNDFFVKTSAKLLDKVHKGGIRTGHEVSIAKTLCALIAETLVKEDYSADENPYIPEYRDYEAEPVRQLAYYRHMSRYKCTRPPFDEFESKVWDTPFYQWWTEQAELMEMILSCVGSTKHTKYMVRPWTDSTFVVVMVSPTTDECKIRWAVYQKTSNRVTIDGYDGYLEEVKLLQFGSQPMFRARAMLEDFHELQRWSATINPMTVPYHMAQLIGIYPCEDVFALGDLTYYLNSETYTRVGAASISGYLSLLKGFLQDKMPRSSVLSYRTMIYLSLAVFGSIRSTPPLCFVPKFFSPQERKSQISLLKANEKEAKAQEAFALSQRTVDQDALLAYLKWLYDKAPLPTRDQSLKIASDFGFKISDVVTTNSSSIREGDAYVSEPCNAAVVRFLKDLYGVDESFPGNGSLLDVSAKASQETENVYRAFAKNQTSAERFIATTNPAERLELGAMRGAVLACGSLGGRDTNVDPSEKHNSVHQHTLLKRRAVAENRPAVQICMDPSAFGNNFPQFMATNAVTVALSKIHGISNSKGVLGILAWVNNVGLKLQTRYLCFSTEELDKASLYTLSGGNVMTTGMSEMAIKMWRENEHAYRMMVAPFYNVELFDDKGTVKGLLNLDLKNWSKADRMRVSPKDQWPTWDTKAGMKTNTTRDRGQVFIRMDVGYEEGQTAPMQSFTWTSMVMFFVEEILKVDRNDYAWTNCADDGLLTILLPAVNNGFPKYSTLYQTGQDILSLMIDFFHNAFHVDLSVRKCVIDITYAGVDKLTPFFYNSHMIDPASAIIGRYCSHVARTLRNVYKWRLFSSVLALIQQIVAGYKAILADHPDIAVELLQRICLVLRATSPSCTGWALYYLVYMSRYKRDKSIALIGFPNTDDWTWIFQNIFALDFELSHGRCLWYYKDDGNGCLVLADEHREYDVRQRKAKYTFSQLSQETGSYASMWANLDFMYIMGYGPRMSPFDCSTYARYLATRFGPNWNNKSIFEEPPNVLNANRYKSIFNDIISGRTKPDFRSKWCRHVFIGKSGNADSTANPVEIIKFWIANGMVDQEMPIELIHELICIGENQDEGEKFEPVFCVKDNQMIYTDVSPKSYKTGESMASIIKEKRECSPVMVSSSKGFSVVKSEDCNGDFYMIRDTHLNCVYNQVSDAWRSPTAIDLLKARPYATDLLPIVLNLQDAHALTFLRTDLSRNMFHMRSYGEQGQVTHLKAELSHSMLLKFGSYIIDREDIVDQNVQNTKTSDEEKEDSSAKGSSPDHEGLAEEAGRYKLLLIRKRSNDPVLKYNSERPTESNTVAEAKAHQLIQDLIKCGLQADRYDPTLPIDNLSIKSDLTIDVCQRGETFTLYWKSPKRRIKIKATRKVKKKEVVQPIEPESSSSANEDDKPEIPIPQSDKGKPSSDTDNKPVQEQQDRGNEDIIRQGYTTIQRQVVIIIENYLRTNADEKDSVLEYISSQNHSAEERVQTANMRVANSHKIWQKFFDRMPSK